MSRRRIIVGISGASGFQYGMKALQLLRDQDVEVHLVVTKGAEGDAFDGNPMATAGCGGSGR